MNGIVQAISCIDGYDPDALHVHKAREAIRACLVPETDSETVAIRDALGRILAQEIVPQINVPGHDNSAMDGYAVRSADLSASQDVFLKMIGSAFAGRLFDGKIKSGECVRVMTGAVMPQGTDSVVVQEVCRADGVRITIPAGQKAGQNVRAAGEDLKAGVAVLQPGQAVRAADLGLMASLGIAQVQVKRRLRVAFFSTGDELISIGTPLAQGQVYDSNRYTLHGMLSGLGVQIIDMGVVRDDPQKLEAAFAAASANADVIITTGGVSVGEADFIKQLMARMGEVLFWKIAMRPGRPMAFGRITCGADSAYLFGLPGNPVAVMVTFHQIVRDALLILGGRTNAIAIPLLKAVSASAIRKVAGRTEYQRGVLFEEGGAWKVRVTGQQGSGVLRSMSEANCYIVLEHERSTVAAGELVSVQLLAALD